MKGKLNGRGRVIQIDGEVYDGEWRDNKQNGFGIKRWPSSAKYEGYWFI